MKILVFSKTTEIYAPQRILQEAKKRGHRIVNFFYKDIAIKIGPDEVEVLHLGKRLSIPDAVVLRVSGMGLAGPLFVYQRVALVDYFPKDCRVLNRDTYQRWPRLNKLEQHYNLIRADLPVVPSYSFSSEEMIDWEAFTYPVIAKTSFGSSGQGVFKPDRREELEKIIQEKGINNLIFQKFLPTRQDFRVIVIGGKALPKAMRKTAAPGEFRTNFAQGGKVEGVDLTEEMRDLAEKSAQVFQADYAGIDIMYDAGGKPYILEINRGAQFQGFEESTKINVPAYMLDFLEKKV